MNAATSANAPLSAASARRRALILAIFGFVQILAAPIVYSLTMDNAFFRRTGLIAWILIADGLFLVGLGLAASRRIPVVILSALSLVLTAVFVVAFFVLAALPPATTIYELASAPAFTLPDQDNRPVSLSDFRGRDRVLLVFYRGHW